ncbi:MAG: PIN domain-containing protein [Desulfobacteraceae bacterium]|nr:PIN domain-containing protein [Desulfobacteraceae bacterium]
MIYLDTHVVAWAYAGEIDRFPPSVCRRIEESDLLISPFVLLELKYLHEIERLTVEPGVIYENLASTIGLAVCDLPLMRVITEALPQTWTRDPFDRIITATATARDAILLTKDAAILTHYPKAFWG